MNKNRWFKSLAIGVMTGLVIAGVMTLLDWRLNPGGIFRDENGPNWYVVAETAASWFFPVAALTGVAAVLVFFALSRFGR